MDRYLSDMPHIDRIISLVQNHQEFFDAHCGQHCIEAAANKLEQLILYGDRSPRAKIKP